MITARDFLAAYTPLLFDHCQPDVSFANQPVSSRVPFRRSLAVLSLPFTVALSPQKRNGWRVLMPHASPIFVATGVSDPRPTGPTIHLPRPAPTNLAKTSAQATIWPFSIETSPSHRSLANRWTPRSFRPSTCICPSHRRTPTKSLLRRRSPLRIPGLCCPMPPVGVSIGALRLAAPSLVPVSATTFHVRPHQPQTPTTTGWTLMTPLKTSPVWSQTVMTAPTSPSSRVDTKSLSRVVSPPSPRSRRDCVRCCPQASRPRPSILRISSVASLTLCIPRPLASTLLHPCPVSRLSRWRQYGVRQRS